MTFTVEDLSTAEDSLAEVWLQAPDRAAVVAGQALVDRLLARDPIGSGQHLHEGLYKLVVSPLTTFYTVDEVHRKVEVSEVWYTS
jgi:hypothetical protein